MIFSPLISIIIPTFNSANFLAETLESVLNQTYGNWECIVVDDGSNDNTLDIIEHYTIKDTRIKFYIRPNFKKKGASSCRNYGIEVCSGNYIIFLDSDDLLAFNCLERRWQFIQQYQDNDLWIFSMQAFMKSKQNTMHTYGYFDEYIEPEFLIKNFLSGINLFAITCPVWKKQTLINIKGFNEDLRIFTDPDLHLRMLYSNFRYKIALKYSPDSYYRLSENFYNKHKPGYILDNSFIFFKTHLNRDSKESVTYFKKIYSKHILDNKCFKYFNKFNRLGINKRVFTYQIFLTSIALIVYHSLGLFKYRGIGYSALKEQFNVNFKS